MDLSSSRADLARTTPGERAGAMDGLKSLKNVPKTSEWATGFHGRVGSTLWTPRLASTMTGATPFRV